MIGDIEIRAIAGGSGENSLRAKHRGVNGVHDHGLPASKITNSWDTPRKYSHAGSRCMVCSASACWPLIGCRRWDGSDSMNALSLIGLTYRVMTKRFVVAWDTGAIAVVYAGAVALSCMFPV